MIALGWGGGSGALAASWVDFADYSVRTTRPHRRRQDDEMTQASAPGGPGRPRVAVASVVVGVVIALAADAVFLTGAPALRAAWDGSPAVASRAKASTPARLPTATKTATPTPGRSPSKQPTSGEVAVNGAISRGIVLIDAQLNATTSSSGTGMVLTADGQVLTNYHVVRSTQSITVRIASTKREYRATLVGRDASRDVALLQLQDASGLATITPDADPVAVDDPVVAAGNARGQGYLTAFAGRIVGTDRSIRVRGGSSMDPAEDLSGLLETNAHAVPGDSGGPLYDAQRQVLGMTTAGNVSKSGGSTGTAFAVPIANALRVVDDIRAGNNRGSVVIGPKASVGIMAADSANGIKVTTVVAGSPAARAGLQVGDYLKAIDDYKLDKVATLVSTLDHFRPGSTVRLSWEHGSAQKSATVALDASKYN